MSMYNINLYVYTSAALFALRLNWSHSLGQLSQGYLNGLRSGSNEP